MPELLALTQQSTPATKVLENTATGLCNMENYKHNVRVLVSEEDDEHVELAFDEDRVGRGLKRADMGVKYG